MSLAALQSLSLLSMLGKKDTLGSSYSMRETGAIMQPV